MSIFHYIAASKELPLGSFGRRKSIRDKKKTMIRSAPTMELPKKGIPHEKFMDLQGIREEEIVVYDTFEDAAGIYISELPAECKAIKKHFKNAYVYQVSPNFGIFLINEAMKTMHQQMYKANEKCISELFNYLRQNINDNEEIELYSCWADEEEKERDGELDKIIDIASFKVKDNFQLMERQYIIFKCSGDNQ